jgi:uncharacterized protein YegJ (DUF2314 family)
MANDFNLLEFAGISDERPWELSPPSKTDLRVVVSGEQIPSIEVIGKAIASFVGDSIEAEEVEPPDQDIHWAMRARINGLTNDILVWAEPLNAASRDATGIEHGWVLALQTMLHNGDPLTHFSNIMRLLLGINLQLESVCDLATGRWFPNEIIDSVFGQDDIEAPEEVLWITRLVEAPEGGDPDDRWAWITTHGLSRCGRVELEMLGVPAVLSNEAVHLVDGLAALTLETPLPPAGQTISLGSNLLISLMKPEEAIQSLKEEMPGNEERTSPSAVITSHDGTSLFPQNALGILQVGETAVMRTKRSTNRRATIAKSQWSLFVTAAKQIGASEHATCLAQIPWSNTEEEDTPREYLWFRVVEIHQDSMTGELAHKPALVTSLEEGHREQFDLEDITDWIVMTPVGPMGPSDAQAIEEFLDQFNN